MCSVFGQSLDLLQEGFFPPTPNLPFTSLYQHDAICDLQTFCQAPAVCVSEESIAHVRFGWLSHVGIKSTGAASSIREAVDTLTITNVAGLAFLPNVHVSCAVIVPFVQLLSDKFRPHVHHRVLFVTVLLIGFTAMQCSFKFWMIWHLMSFQTTASCLLRLYLVWFVSRLRQQT